MGFLGLLFCFSLVCTEVFGSTEITAVQRGLSSANSFTIAASNFLTSIGSLASKISPLFDVFMNLLSIIQSITIQRQSPELLAIKQLYETVNAKFDHMESRLNDIENGIHWDRAMAPVLNCERDIRILLASFQMLSQNPPPDAAGQRSVLLDRYRYRSNCPHILYYAIVNDTGLGIGYSNNILEEGKSIWQMIE